jgi:hypothetical protein
MCETLDMLLYHKLQKAQIMKSSEIVGDPPGGKLYHGVFPAPAMSEEDYFSIDDLISYEDAVEKPVTWAYFSNIWGYDRRFPMGTATCIRHHGSIPYIRLSLRSNSKQCPEPTFTLDRIVKGDFDFDLRSWFDSAARIYRSPLIVEYGGEVNGCWEPWNGYWNGCGEPLTPGDNSTPDCADKFRAAYRHIIQIAREQEADNILWVFHVNYVDNPDNKTWNRLEQYYPGDEWIDWLGVSVYGMQEPTDQDTDDDWPDFSSLMTNAYDRLNVLSDTKPIVVCEFGVTRHPRYDQAAWAEAALSDLVALCLWPRVIGFSWWNERWKNKGCSKLDTNMRVQDNTKLRDVFRKYVGENDAVLEEAVLVER